MPNEQLSLLSGEWDQDADIIVIGSGFSGLAVAIEASDAGAAVIVLEKSSRIGGNSIIALGCLNAVHPERQKIQGINDSLQKHFEQTWSGGGNRCEPNRIQAVLNEGAETMQWLQKFGIEWKQNVDQGYGALWPRSHMPLGRGKSIVLALKHQVENRGVPILLGHKVVKIIRENHCEGKVLGVGVKTRNQSLLFEAKIAVVIASGGYTADDALVAKHDNRLKDLEVTGNKDATGELIILSQGIGSDTVGMDYIQCIPKAYNARTGERYSTRVLHYADILHVIHVNHKGQRIVSSDSQRDVVMDAILSQSEKCSFILCDDMNRQLKQIGLEESWRSVNKGRMFGGNTIKELAENMGVPPDALYETIAKYNSYVARKNDPDFHQAPHTLVNKIETPPFWATSLSMARHYTCGGLRVGGTKWTQVLDRWGRIIPRYYAAGEVTGGFHGANRLGCNATLECIVAGRWAGSVSVKGHRFQS